MKWALRQKLLLGSLKQPVLFHGHRYQASGTVFSLCEGFTRLEFMVLSGGLVSVAKQILFHCLIWG